MTHYSHGIMLPTDGIDPFPLTPEREERLRTLVEARMAPFDDNLDVAPYQAPCGCAEPDPFGPALALRGALADDKQAEIKARQLYLRLEAEAVPQVDCPDCQGTGIKTVTWNPRGRWDWYVIGGRWAGLLVTGRMHGSAAKEMANNCAWVRDCASRRFASLLTPDGRWHGKAAFYRVQEGDVFNWDEVREELFNLYPDCLIVGVDYHN